MIVSVANDIFIADILFNYLDSFDGFGIFRFVLASYGTEHLTVRLIPSYICLALQTLLTSQLLPSLIGQAVVFCTL